MIRGQQLSRSAAHDAPSLSPATAPATVPATAGLAPLAAPGVPRFLQQPVRVHDDNAAHAAAAAKGAYGFTLGSDIYLGPGLGRPGMPARSAVVRHETVHALQTQQPGAPAPEPAIEQQAHTWDGSQPLLPADPTQPHGLFWIPVIAGLYVLLRSSPANAPGPGDRTYPSLPWWQPALEAIAIFGIPGAAGISLARAGWSVVGVSAVEGSLASVGYRGVQDLAAGEFSGIEAYVVDAATGAVVGVVVGGVFQVWKSSKLLKVPGGSSAGAADIPGPYVTGAPGEASAATPNTLYHHTNALDAIESSGKVLGNTEGRVYTTQAGEIGSTTERLATGVGSKVGQRVAFEGEAAGMFERHPAEGWFSWYKRRGGQYVSQRVGYNLAFEANAAAREGNTLTVSQAAWQRQAGRRFFWSHARLWGRRMLVDWGIPSLAAWGLMTQYGAYGKYPKGRVGIAGQNAAPGSAATPAQPGSTPGPAPAPQPDAGVDAGVDFGPDAAQMPLLDFGLEPLPGLGPEAGAGAGLDDLYAPLTLSPFMPGQVGAGQNAAQPGGPDSAGANMRPIKIIYVEHYDMRPENLVSEVGYNTECPSCHDRTRPQQTMSKWNDFAVGKPAESFLSSGGQSTLPNFLNTAGGQLTQEQRIAMAQFLEAL